MRFGSSDQSEKTLDADNAQDLSGAQVSLSISGLNYEDTQKSFWATIDRVLFKKPLEVVSAVLDGQGYVVNLENILACLDRFCFGVRAKVVQREDQIKVKQYAPAITFHMPSKTQVGPLLQMFYDEIAGYEAELAKLQHEAAAAHNREDHDKSEDELRREVGFLRAANDDMAARIEELSAKLSQSKQMLNQQEEQYGEEQILPDDMRLAKVIGVYLEERSIALRTSRNTFHFPMASTDVLPERGQGCVVTIVNGIVKGAFFYEAMGNPFEKRLAEVLYVSEDAVKLRDRERFQWVLRPRNQTEQDVLKTLQRGHEVMISLYQNQLLKIERVKKINENKFQENVQESVVLHQLVAVGHQVALADDEVELKEVS